MAPFSIRRTFCPPGDGATVVAVIGIDPRERTAWTYEVVEDTPGGVSRPDLLDAANERLDLEWAQDVAEAMEG